MTTQPGFQPSILLVDDEEAILDGLRRQLRKRFAVHTATGGAAALELLESQPVSVVVSDMRMPQMDGATFLARVRERHPDVVRILLTGQADTQSAIAAVNDGQVYRFLTKPCSPIVLADEIAGAVEMNRLVTAEKELLAITLRRTVEALTATLSLAQPAAFARAARVTRTVTETAAAMGLAEPWAVEITAMLAHLGAVTLPPELLHKLNSGERLTDADRAMEARVATVSRDLVAAIPRLEEVAASIGLQRVRFDGAGREAGEPRGEDLPLGARMLRAAADLDAETTRRGSVREAVDVMRADPGAYDPEVLDALIRSLDLHAIGAAPRKIDLRDLEPGMVVFDDIETVDGVLLVGRGTVVSEPLIARLENHLDQDRVHAPVIVRA
ncbi:response regulator [Modestobacter sp. I12A-02628]|uniref:Response regulator n=1 Tax=Goekera deserti TaxID=2497753 RepID=A0A7K3WJ76_9ACTN|nr:HD domain-containing phosphohydrolase [Goekera deserti]MPR00519.1 response regulator [Goekera deserti]NDI50455.1 response regulator [Goekera deserti]NEL56551.1 response regulator [Goekera deserti]